MNKNFPLFFSLLNEKDENSFNFLELEGLSIFTLQSESLLYRFQDYNQLIGQLSKEIPWKIKNV